MLDRHQMAGPQMKRGRVSVHLAPLTRETTAPPNRARHESMSMANETKALNVLLGLAAGDRIGGPLQMALCVAESLAERRGFDSDDILARYLDWWRTEGFDTGPTAGEVFACIERGMTPAEASRHVDCLARGMTAGCNPAHRNVALALTPYISDDELAEAAMIEARITHIHPLAGDVAAAAVRLCRALLHGASSQDALDFAAAGRLSETRDALALRDFGKVNRGGYAPDVLRAAAFFVDSSQDLAEALERAIVFAGVSNYCPVLVGSIGGARWWGESLAPHWHERHGGLIERIWAVVRRLTDQ